MMTSSSSALESLLLEKISLGEALMDALAAPEMTQVEGRHKLEKKIKQELKFLVKFRDSASGRAKLKKEHLQCSNLQHLSAIVQV